MKTLFYIVLLHSLFFRIEPSLAQWVVKDTNKGAQQPLLQLVKDAFGQSHQITKPPRLKKSQLQPFAQVKDTDKLQGLFTLYRHKETGKIYLELKPGN